MVPSTSTILTEWEWLPSVLLGILLWSLLYAYAVGPLRRRYDLGPPPTRTQVNLFVASQVVLVVALLSPIDYLGDRYLFSVHMIQHLLLASLWPPLVLLSMPGEVARPLFRLPVIGTLALFFTAPAVALPLFNANLAIWHIPGLYDLTLSNETVHIAEHLTFMGFGILNWWPILSPISEQRLTYPFQILYLFLDGMLMMALAIVFTFAPAVFYTPYAQAPRLWGLSAQTDQSLGGLIMWYPGNLPYGIWMAIAFYRWFEGGGSEELQSRSA